MGSGSKGALLERELRGLLQSDDRVFAFVQQGSLDGMWAWDLQSGGWFSERFKETLGYAGVAIGDALTWWREHIVPEDAERAMAGVLTHAADPTSPPYDAVVHYRHRDGRILAVRCRAMAVRDASARATLIVGAHTDVTALELAAEATRAREAAQASEGLLRASFDALPHMVWTARADGTCEYANRRWVESTGEAPESLRGARWLDRVHPDDRRAAEAEWASAIESEDEMLVMLRLRTRGRTFRVMELRAAPMRGQSGAIERWVVGAADITERALAEAARRESEATFETMLANCSEGIVISSLDGILLHFNRAATVIHALEEGEGEIRSFADLDASLELRTMDGQIVPIGDWPIARICRGEALRDVDMRVSRRDGTHTRIVRYAGSIVPRRVGAPVAMLAMTDRTSEHDALEAVRANEERLRLANEVAGIGTYDWDLVTGSGSFSPEWQRIYGIDPGDPDPVRAVRERIHPEDRAVMDAQFAREGIEGDHDGVVRLELRIRRPDGEPRAVAWTGRRIFELRDGKRIPVRSLGACVDVTEQRRAEQRLATQSAVSAALADSSTLSEAGPRVMRAICDAEGWDVGEIWERDTTHEVLRCAEMWHRPGRGLETFAAQARAMTFAPSVGLPGRVWASREPLAISDVRREPGFVRRDEAAAHDLVGAIAFPIVAGSELFGVILFLGPRLVDFDDTQRARFAAIGAQLGAFFERKVAEAARARLEDQLRHGQKMEALGRLSGGIAHDFNNLLAAILSNVEAARTELALGAPIAPMLDDIEAAGRRARDTVVQILSFARQQPERRVVRDLQPIVEESLRLLRATLPAGVQLAWKATGEIPLVRADETALQQVVLNLATNAWHALDGKGGTIDVRLDAVDLDAAAASAYEGLSAGRYARLRVRDDGHGMDADTLGQIFDPFFTTKGPGRGTGLGLAAVHGIIKSHDGAVRVESTPGIGSTFEILVPASTTTPTTLSVSGGPVARGSGEEILYVDDEPMLVRVAQRVLGRLGYRVTAMSHAREAVATFEHEPDRFAMVITDMNMPDLSGADVLVAVRKVRGDVPVIVVSGYVPDELRTRASDLGATHVLTKPFTSEQLASTVARTLAARAGT